VFTYEDEFDPSSPYASLYARAMSVLEYLRQPSSPKWAHHFFSYDHLTLVSRDAILAIGGWDTHIPYYATDCDMYVRLMWAGYWQGATDIGLIFDVASVMDDLGALLRIPGARASFAGDPEAPSPLQQKPLKGGRNKKEKEPESWANLASTAKRMEDIKYTGGSNDQRNTWQMRQTGGRGEPFARDPEGFETGLQMMIDTGRAVFAEKWGHRGCDIARMGIRPEDAWRLERDWDPETEGPGSQGGDW